MAIRAYSEWTTEVHKYVTEKRLEFLFELYNKGIALAPAQLELLTEYEYIKPDVGTYDFDRTTKNKLNRKLVKNYDVKSEAEFAADERVDIVEADENYIKSDIEVISSEKHEKQEFQYKGKRKIETHEWKPDQDNILNYPKAFVKWIDSINNGFLNKTSYEKFSLYKQQAASWLAKNESINDYNTSDEQYNFAYREKQQCTDNSLYFLNKYHLLKEGDTSQGGRKYKAWECQAVICFLFDCGYNLMIGKGRQIGFSSTIGGLCEKRLIFHKSYFVKFITESLLKGQEIFEDKVKFPFYHLPSWIKPTVNNDRDDLIALFYKPVKGDIAGVESKMQVVAPTVTAINGGSPNLVAIDEIGLIDILGKMMNEGRPALFWVNDRGQMKMQRQLIAWGCVCAGTKVWTNNGDLINIEDLKQEDGIIGYEDNVGMSKENISYQQKPIKKDCYRVTTNTGRFLECSDDHPILWSHQNYGITPRPLGRKFFKQKKFVEAKDIKPGDQIAILESAEVFGQKRMFNPRLIGLLIGDGSYRIDSTPVLSNCDEEINDYIESNFETTTEKSYITKDGRVYKETRIREICPELRKLGIYGQTKLQKTLPLNIHSYQKSDICELLGGFFDADGCVQYTKERRNIELTSASYSLLDEVRFLLQKIGIHSNITRIKCNPSTNPIDKNDWFVLTVSDKRSINMFYKNISFLIGYKQDRLEIIVDRIKDKRERISKTIHGIRFERVVNVEYIGKQTVYNLTATTTHTYVANGIVTHNTGGNMKKAGKEFEVEFKAATAAWKDRNFKYGIIPIFFDCFAKPGVDQEFYDNEKKIYYLKGPDSAVQFHQHYPVSIDDMFLVSSETMWPMDSINKQIRTIKNLKPLEKPKYGHFIPLYDYGKPKDEKSDVPYEISGAEFVPVEDGDPSATTVIFRHPEEKWMNRYFQGTDPIYSETGHSLMSSAIWDNVDGTVSACMNYRIRDYRYCYLQALLLGLYYDNKNCRNLVESNVGSGYNDYIDNKGFFRTLVPNRMLSLHLRIVSGQNMGINKKGNTGRFILNKLQELLEVYGSNIFIEEFFIQLKTYVRKTSREGHESFKVENAKYYYDDVIDAVTYAYICAQSFAHLNPVEPEANKARNVKHRYYLDDNYNLCIKKTLV